MADLLGNMNQALVNAYKQSKMAEIPSVVAMSKGFEGMQEKALELTEEGFASVAGGKTAGKAYDKDPSQYPNKTREQVVAQGQSEGRSQVTGTGSSSSVTSQQLIGLGWTPPTTYSPLKQTEQPAQEGITPPSIDYAGQLEKVVADPLVNELNQKHFNAAKQVIGTAVDAAVESGDNDSTAAVFNQIEKLNADEKANRKYFIEQSKNASIGAVDSVNRAFEAYLNPANDKIVTLNPENNQYSYATIINDKETGKPTGETITNDALFKAMDEGTKNDAAKAGYLKHTNSIIEQQKDATTSAPKNEAYFNSIGKNVVEADEMKKVDLIFGDIREGGNFAEDLKTNPEILGLDTGLIPKVYDAITNPDNPNFDWPRTKELLIKYFALDFKKTHDSVGSTAQARPGQDKQKDIDTIINDAGITKQQFPDLF